MRTWFKTRFLISGLGQGTIRERSDRVEDLTRIGVRAVKPLISVLRGHEPDVVMDALRALGRIGDRRAIPEIEHVAKDEDELVREHALWALRVLKISDRGKSNRELMSELKNLRSRVTQAVREREQLARALLDACPYLAMLLDRDARILALNQPMADSIGKDRAELVGTSLRDVVHPDVRDGRQRAFEATIGTGRSMVLEDGHSGKWFESFIEPVLGDQGEVVQIAVFARDVTESRAARNDLRRYREELDQQYRALPVPLFTWKQVDGLWRLTDFNEAAKAISGGQTAAILDRPLPEVHADRPDIVADVEECGRTGAGSRRRMRYRYRATGTERLLDVHYIPLAPDRVVVLTYDVTGVAGEAGGTDASAPNVTT